MKRTSSALARVLTAVWVAALAMGTAGPAATPEGVSGRLVDGIRVLTVENGRSPLHFRVYRGDYIKFEFDAASDSAVLTIPALSVNQVLPRDVGEASYVKMKTTGAFEFGLGRAHGRIEVIDYQRSHYRELSSREADEFIATARPLILDVRTPREFEKSRIENAVLIPVQELSRRLDEIADYKERDILVYCATGNRSTVASKILNDNGFMRVTNMRQGIVQWAKEDLPLLN